MKYGIRLFLKHVVLQDRRKALLELRSSRPCTSFLLGGISSLVWVHWGRVAENFKQCSSLLSERVHVSIPHSTRALS